jgi:hypothetical protein
MALVDAFPEASDGQPAGELAQVAVVDVGDEQPRRVRAEIDRRDAQRDPQPGRKTRSQRTRACA